MKTNFALLHVDGGRSLAIIETKLARMGLKVATVSEEWIGLQCFSMERRHIIARNPAGTPATFFFSWGRLHERELRIVYEAPIVAVELSTTRVFPRGSWWFDPIGGRMTIEDFLCGKPITELVKA